MRALKKNIGQISGKVNEGDEIKKKFDQFRKKIIDKQTSKQAWLDKSPKINCFFGNRQQSNARAWQEKTHVFLGNERS